MRILRLQAENWKRLKVVDIRPDGSLVPVTGRNGQGKSSVLDAIWAALGGAGAVPSTPIRKGEEHAVIRLDLGDIKVVREFAGKEDGTYATRIRVETAEGARFPSPQKMLDALWGSLTFDPLKFARSDAKAQAAMLSRLCGVDLSALDEENRVDFAERTNRNRQAKKARAAAESITVPADTPEKPVSVSDLVTDLRDAERSNRERDRERGRREGLRARIADVRDSARRAAEKIAELEGQIAELKNVGASYTKEANDLEADLEALPQLAPPLDTGPIQEKIAGAEQVNQHVADAGRKRALLEEAKDHEAQSQKLTAAMKNRQKEAGDKIAAAELGVEGLTVKDGKVCLNDLFLDDASSADRLRVSCAIGMRGDHKLKVLLVREGSTLDSASLKLLAAIAKEHGYQVWIEIVDESGAVGIVLEDGMVVASKGDGTKAAAEPPQGGLLDG